jgi:Na+/H+ antiporter NhaD/arsenite permease-like protein
VSAPPPSAEARGQSNARRYAENLAGFLAAAAIMIGAIALAYRPFRIAPAAILLALIAAAIGGRSEKLIVWAVYLTALFFFFGMVVAVVTRNPVY